jgi:hypothetical protein
MCKLKISDKIAIISMIASILVPVVLWVYSARISFYLAKQQVEIKGFESLLSNSKNATDRLDSELGVLKNQLTLNVSIQKEANINAAFSDEANMNMGTKEAIMKSDSAQRHFFVASLRAIFESQLTNQYLEKNDTLVVLWIKAYNQLYYYVDNPGGFQRGDFDRSWDIGPETRLDEINPKLNRDIGDCWDAANKAYENALKYLKKDIRFLKIK